MFGLPDQLLVTLTGNVLSTLLIFCGGLFVFFNNPRVRTNQLFAYLMLATGTYEVLFVTAMLQSEHFAAYFWWFLNIFDVFITMAVVHFILHITKRERAWQPFLILTYVVGFLIFAYAWVDQHAFLPDVVPKLYFYYYLSAGWLYDVMLAYFLVFPLIAFSQLIVAYWHSGGVERKRYEYIILMLVVGYVIGCVNFGLVYDVPLDPVFGMFFGFFFLPVAYGIFAHNLLDIRLVFKRAFYFGSAVGLIAAFLTLLILLNDYLVRTVPYLRFWTVPLATSLVAVSIARLVWGQTRDTDRLKYEFITIAAHKLRTPLTRIRWEIPPLLEKVKDLPEVKEGLVRIDVANNRLIELTNILMESAHTEDTSYSYKKDPVDLGVAIKNALGRFEAQIKEKNISVVSQVDPAAKKPLGDPGRLASVVDVLVENAVIYNKNGGSIHISLQNERSAVRFSISDTGIGVTKEDADRIFSSFYRTDAAKRADTEGVGIGLSVAKNIIEKHGGTIGVESPGDSKGSTFWFMLPV